MGSKLYDDEDRAYWISVLEMAGKDVKFDKDGHDHSVLQVSKMPGSPSGATLRRWWNNRDKIVDDDVLARARAPIKSLLSTLAHAHAKRSLELVEDSLSLRDVNGGLALILDKLALMEMRPTSIVTTVDYEQIKRLLIQGKLSEDELKERWPTLADSFFTKIEEALE